MKANRSALSLSTFLFSIALSINAVASDDLPEITEEGLHKLKDTNLGLVYAQPDADLNVYNRVKLLEPSVAFTSERFKISKAKAAWVMGAIMIAVGLISVGILLNSSSSKIVSPPFVTCSVPST